MLMSEKRQRTTGPGGKLSEKIEFSSELDDVMPELLIQY